MHYCTFKGDKGKRLDMHSEIYKLLSRKTSVCE